MRNNPLRFRCLLAGIFCLLAANASAEDQQDFVPKPGVFPPPNSGHYFVGELVSVDHVNRRGALRLEGTKEESMLRWEIALPHQFAMLPYGTIRYHGAPAELRDVPIGTHLHGYFVLPPEGDKTIPEPPQPPKRGGEYIPKYNHAISLEDDVSYYQRQGQSWKIVSVDTEENPHAKKNPHINVKKGKLKVSAVPEGAAAGVKSERIFEFDASTRIWQGKQNTDIKALAVGQVVQVNLTWETVVVGYNYHCTDIWLDKEALDNAAEIQRQIHIRYQRYRGLAGWVDHVEHGADGRGILTFTLFSGMDQTLYDHVPVVWGVHIRVAEVTLRGWKGSSDDYRGLLDFKKLPNPPLGSSGLQLRMRIDRLAEGHRPGRIIRFFPAHFPGIFLLPPEERMKSLVDDPR